MLVSDRDGVQQLQAKRWAICTGGYPQPLAFPGNDLPGVMLGRAVRRLIRYGVRPGRQVVIVTDSDAGLELAEDLRARSITVSTVADMRSGAAAASGIQAASGHTVLSARGRGRVASVMIGPIGATAGSEIQCDTLCIDVTPAPADELVLQLLTDGSITLERPASEEWSAGHAEVTAGVWIAGQVKGSGLIRRGRRTGRGRGPSRCAGGVGCPRVTEVADTVEGQERPVVFEHSVRTRWADGDPFGHVNHAVFITYLEEARDLWFEATLGSCRVYVIVRIEIDLKQELFPNTGDVTVRISVEELGRTKMVTNEDLIGPGGTVVASARVDHGPLGRGHAQADRAHRFRASGADDARPARLIVPVGH